MAWIGTELSTAAAKTVSGSVRICDSDSGGVGRRPIGRQDGGALMAGGYFAEIEG